MTSDDRSHQLRIHALLLTMRLYDTDFNGAVLPLQPDNDNFVFFAWLTHTTIELLLCVSAPSNLSLNHC